MYAEAWPAPDWYLVISFLATSEVSQAYLARRLSPSRRLMPLLWRPASRTSRRARHSCRGTTLDVQKEKNHSITVSQDSRILKAVVLYWNGKVMALCLVSPVGGSTNFWVPVLDKTNKSYEATEVGSWSFVGPIWARIIAYSISHLLFNIWNISYIISQPFGLIRTHKWSTPNVSGFIARLVRVLHRGRGFKR